MKKVFSSIMICVMILSTFSAVIPQVKSEEPGAPIEPLNTDNSLNGAGYDFYSVLSYDRGDPSTRVLIIALEAYTIVTLDTNWDGAPEFSWDSGAKPYRSHVFQGDDTSIPPGTHIHATKPILAAQWHGIEPEPWYDSGAISLLPYELWGKQYIVGKEPAGGGKIEITAPIPGTVVFVDTNNDGTPEYTWTSTSTDRHHLFGIGIKTIPCSNVTATEKILVASLYSDYDGYAGTPSYAVLGLPLELLGGEFYGLQWYPDFPGDGGHISVEVACPYLPSSVEVGLDVRTGKVNSYDLTSYDGNSESVSEASGELFDTLEPIVSYAKSSKVADASYATFAHYYSQNVDAKFGATIIPVNQLGKDYFVLEDPDDSELGLYKRLISIIAPTVGTHVTIDVDHDGSWEYEWTSTSTNMNVTFTNLPASSHIQGDHPFIAQQLVYRNDYRDPRAYELLPTPTPVAPDFEISVLPSPTITLHVGGWNASTSLVITSIAGFSGTIQLTYNGPPVADIKFDRNPIYLPADSQVTVKMNVTSVPNSPLFAYTFVITATGSAISRELTLVINIVGNSIAVNNLVYLQQIARNDPAFSMQQNFFIAAPNGTIIYWGQNIIQVGRRIPLTEKRIVFSRFQVFSISDFNTPIVNEWRGILPGAAKIVAFPVVLNLTSYIEGHELVLENNASSYFNSASLSLPEGAYIVGYPGSDLGFTHVSPEIVVVGRPYQPYQRIAVFHHPTSGLVESHMKLAGELTWRSTQNVVLNIRNNPPQTAEESRNLRWSSNGAFEYSLRNVDQGISFSPSYE